MNSGAARAEILRSIRTHLSASAPHDAGEQIRSYPCKSVSKIDSQPIVEVFKQNLEAVDGHCIIAHGQTEVDDAITRITKGKRIGTSNEEFSHQDLFKLDVGITYAQAGIAETGTLVLDSSRERNRLVSLVPPVHIAILDAARICATLGETLALLQSADEISPAITFITGPSRTGDIELTLTVGVHGPQELYVIVNQAAA